MDPFARKEWYVLKTPAMFQVRTAGRTLINKTAGQSTYHTKTAAYVTLNNNCVCVRFCLCAGQTEIASEGLKGRVFETSLADLNGGDENQAYRKIRLVVEDVQGEECICNFAGMDITRDKLCSLIRKWQSLIEGSVDVRTTDGYHLRVFSIAFTRKQASQKATKPCYAQASQIRSIRKKMVDIINEEASKCDLREFVQKL